MPSTISHLELRSSCDQVLRRVRAGETIEISDHGEVVAIMIPPRSGSHRSLRARLARTKGGFGELRSARLDSPIQSSIDDLRARRE